MASSRVSFAIVDPAHGREAYQWHRGFAAANEHLYPRTWRDYEKVADEGRVFCARDENDDLLALSYFAFDAKEKAWEIGGLMVTTKERARSIGTVIARLTLGHVLFEEDPLSRGEVIVAHVHAENQDPRTCSRVMA